PKEIRGAKRQDKRRFRLAFDGRRRHGSRPSVPGPRPAPSQAETMRVTLERSNLLKALNHVHRVVERRNTIPILSNVLLRAEGANVQFKATDLDLEITESASSMVEKAGATTVPAHLLYEIVRKLPDGSEVALTVNTEGTAMTVNSGRSKFSLQCLPEGDF